MYGLLVLGGGAAGFAAAITCARQIGGAKIAIVEGNDRVLKKLALTGNGQCNLTNVNKGKYFGDEAFAERILSEVSVKDTLAFFKSIGVETTTEKSGKVFPRSRQASSVSDCLRYEAAKLGISVFLNERINSVEKVGDVFEVKTSGKDLLSLNVIYALGGAACPKLLSSQNNLKLLDAFELKFEPFVPALVQLSLSSSLLKPLKGIKAEVNLSIFADGKKVATKTDEIHFAGNAISGPATFSLSPYATVALAKKQQVSASIDFFPEFSCQELEELFLSRCLLLPSVPTEIFLTTLVHNTIGKLLVKAADINPRTLVCDLSREEILRLAKVSKALFVGIDDSFGFSYAQSSVGGISTKELDPNLMSKKVDGLYVVGEAVDVCGECGGYNLQWAWSSGIVAGKNVALSLSENR